MPSIISCPQCAMQLKVPDTMAPGTPVRCPKCSNTFPVPAPDAAPQQGQFKAAPPGPAAPRPAAPRWDPEMESPDQPRDPFGRRGSGMDGVSGDYKLDLGVIFGQAIPHFTQVGDVLLPMVAFTLVFFLIYIPVSVIIASLAVLLPIFGNLIGGVLSAAVYIPLTVGMMYVALLQVRGRGWSFGYFFAGFWHWKAVFLNGLMLYAVIFVCYLPGEIFLLLSGAHPSAILMQVYQAIQSGKPPATIVPPDPTLQQIGTLFQYMGMAAVLAIYVRYFSLCGYLITERHCGPLEAVHANVELTRGHYWGWLGITLLLGIIGYFPMIFCCFPFLVSWPLYHLLSAAAYVEAIGRREPAQNPQF